MADPLAKVSAGDPLVFPAETFNTFVDAAKAYLGQRQNTRAANLPETNTSACVVQVKNASGEDAARFTILGIDGPLFTYTDNAGEFQNHPSLKGVEPTVADHLGKWVVLQEPIAAGKIGRGVVMGLTPARVYVNTATDQFCDVIVAKTVGSETVYLGTGASGAQILWLEDDTPKTIVWAIVRIGGGGGSATPAMLFQLDSDLDGNNYLATARAATELNEYPFTRTAAGGDPTVFIANTTRSVGVWAGDWVLAQDTGLTYTHADYGELPVYELTTRLSAKLTYWATMTADLDTGGAATALVSINGVDVTRTIHDRGVIAPNQTVYIKEPVLVTYDPDPNIREWYLSGASCYTQVGL